MEGGLKERGGSYQLSSPEKDGGLIGKRGLNRGFTILYVCGYVISKLILIKTL